MTHLLATLALIFIGCGSPDNQPPAKPAEPVVTQAQETDSPAAFVASLEVYKVGVVRKGANWTAETPAKLKELAQKNAEPWRAQVIDGSLVGVMNIADPAEIVSVLFFKGKTEEAVRSMASGAPAVTSGLVKAEVLEVWGTKGLGVDLRAKVAADPKAPLAKEQFYLVYTTKGKKWSADSEAPETRQATNDQIKYIAGLAKGGAVKYFGVFTDMSQNIRGFAIVKAGTEKEALDMLANSPMVKSGALEAGVKTVEVTEGMLK